MAHFNCPSRMSYTPGGASGSAVLTNLLGPAANSNLFERRERQQWNTIPEEEEVSIPSNREEISMCLSHKLGGPPNDPSNDSGSDSPADFGRNHRRGPPIPPRSPRRPTPVKTESPSTPRHVFDKKLKLNEVPAWDGDHDSLTRWMDRINSLAKLSPEVHTELGAIVPRRFTGDADIWYWSINSATRDLYEKSWDTLKAAIRGYFMNDQWLEKQRIRATSAQFRDTTAPPYSICSTQIKPHQHGV